MNKLELLYKVSKTMKTKEKISGTVHMTAFNGEKQMASITNNFVKDIKNETMSLDINAESDLEDLKFNKSVKKELSFEEMHKKHHGHHGHHGHDGKCKFNKFAKLEMMFKTLNDIKVSEEGNLNVLELDITEILEKKKEKMAQRHANCEKFKESEEFKKHAKEFENCELKDIIKLKHAVLKELMSSKAEKAVLKVTVAEDFSIKEVNVYASGEKSLKAAIKLNY